MEQSAIEQHVISSLQALGVPIVSPVKLGHNWVFDGAVNGTKLLIEIHGDYWHSQPEVQERDARKQVWADAEGYQILTIWEDDIRRDMDHVLIAAAEQAHAALAAARLRAAEADNVAKVAVDRPRRADYGDWRDVFLEGLELTGIYLDGCEAAGVSYEILRRHRREDPDFGQAVKDARKRAADRLRRTYHRRADQQSDRAMEYMLRQLDPDEAGGPSLIALLIPYLDLTKLNDQQVEQLATGADPIAVIFGGVTASGTS